jgi:hypothetical protein
MTTRDSLIEPLQVRFTEPEDIEKYGADWYVYDELMFVTKPARELIPLEMEIGAPLATVMDGVRESSVFGDTAAAWLAMRAAGQAVPFAEFNPIIMLAQWRKMPKGEPGKAPAEDSAPADSAPTSTGTPATDVVTLPTSPPVESPA